MNSFISLNYKKGTSISDQLSKFQGLLDQMSGMNIKFMMNFWDYFYFYVYLSLGRCFRFLSQVLLLGGVVSL